MANVSQLQPANIPHVQSSSSEALDKDADFLALRLLNKRARLRLSPAPLDLSLFPGKASLFAIANSRGWFAAITRDAGGASALILSPLANLRSALSAVAAEEEQPYRPQRRVPINGPPPHILTFAYNDSRILLGFVDGSIHVYAADPLFSSGDGPMQPIHVFATSSSAALLSIQSNPGDIPELVAVLRDSANNPGSLAVELLDVQKLSSSGGWMSGKSPSTTPTSISWSPKGKQLALGLQSGDIVTFSPNATATPKSCIPHPPSANNMSVISVHWLSSSSFHTIYAPPGQPTPNVEQIHFHVSLDSKSNSAQDVKFNNPYLPFPGLRPPGEFQLCLRGWDPSRLLLFIGDSTSSDIGLIGSVTGDSGECWYNLALEETSTPSLPLDSDQNDTVLLGMDADLTSNESYHHSTPSGEALELPAHPTMFVYASDGTILGWHVLNVTGTPYPGMTAVQNAPSPALSVPPVPSSIVRELSSDMQTTPTISPTTSAPAEEHATKSSTVFGQPSVFGAQRSAFGQPSAFGQTQSGFGQQSTPVFGKASSFGQTQTTTFGSTSPPSLFGQSSTPAFGSAAPSMGFGAFSSTGPAKFGQPTFGFGDLSQVAPTQVTQPPSTTVPEESMAADDAPSLGGLGLGPPVTQDADSKPSVFGNTSVSASGQQSTGGSLIKPGTGFGAFGGFDQKSPFAKPTASTIVQPSTTTFGTNAFQPKTESASSSTSFGTSPSFGMGQSLFGHTAPTSTFGQPAFGQSSFGQLQNTTSTFGKPSVGVGSGTVPATLSVNDSAGGAFTAFASGTQSAFGTAAAKNAPTTKPVWATGDSSKPRESSPFGTSNVFTKPVESRSPSAVPRDVVATEDDSRSPSPVPTQPKMTTTPAFSSTTPGPSTGAFSNLQTTPSAFIKPASGVFGELPKDSPFFKPPESKLVSAFSLLATPGAPSATPPKTSSVQPAFGASSIPGGALQSAFTSISATPTQPPPPPGAGAFSAFASGGGFAAFSSGGNKSFSDLLRSKEEVKPSKTESPETIPTKPAQSLSPATAPISTTPATTPVKEPPKPPSVPAETPKPEEEEKTVEAKSTAEPAEPKEKPVETIPVQELSLESISSSTSSSFVKVSTEEEGEVVEEDASSETESQHDESDSEYEPSETPEEEESDISEGEDESEVPEEEDSEVQEEEGSEVLSQAAAKEEAEEPARKVEPTEVPLSVTPVSTRSPSTTPKAEYPRITVSPSPPPQALSPSTVPRVSPIRELGTTPPGTPAKDSIAPVQMPVPISKASPPPPTFGLVPRANNRPIRSSPLASTSIVLEGEAESPPPVPKSAPPAAPNVPFGQWTMPPPSPATDANSARPPTPLTSSLFPAPSEKKPPAASLVSTTTLSPPPSVFSPPPEKVATATTAPATFASLPIPPLTFSTSLPSTVTPSTWGTSLRSADATPPTVKVAQSFFGGQPGLFGAKMGPLSSTPSPFASPFTSIVPSPSPTPPLPKTPSQPPTPTPEQGMQAECSLLLSTLEKELENLKQLATAASLKMGELRKTPGVNHQKADLGDRRKWVLGDIEVYGRILVDIQSDVKELKLQRVSLRKVMKELESNMIKINTRREEIVRFNKAKADTEFAKMLKIRTLAPEYAENQSQLRKNIRVIKDRVQKLEDHLQASKKRIYELRTGRPSIRPPSLDTVNRTFRNIDIAIGQEKQEISQLRHRMAKLEVSGSVGARDQLAISSSKRPVNVTSNVAITTAAALNAERSAQRLKKAMLASRTQPLLNTMAIASSVPTSFETPQKGTVVKLEAKTPDGTLVLPTTPIAFPSPLLDWTPPSSSEYGSPSPHDITPSRSRGVAKHHQRPIILKKNASPAGPTQPSLFQWQPVEPVKPVSSLPFALRPAGSG